MNNIQRLIAELRELDWGWEVGNTGSRAEPKVLLFLCNMSDDHALVYRHLRVVAPTIEEALRQGVERIRAGSYDASKWWPKFTTLRNRVQQINSLAGELDRFEKDLTEEASDA